jgi:anti-sigma regulatory factor (Ser/Thr protein kinase)
LSPTTSPTSTATGEGPESPALTNVSLGRLSVPVDLAYLRPVQSCTADIARMLSFDAPAVTMLQLAAEEGFTNAVNHFSRKPGADENIHVEFNLSGRDFVISIRDRGIPFDIDEVEQFEASDGTGADKPGIGLALMKQSVDKVELISAGRDGKELRLTKHLPEGTVLPASMLQAGEKARKTRRPVDLDSVIIREPTEADLPAIRRLTWRSYGYRYNTKLYDLNKLRDLYHSGLYLPLIAVDPNSGEALFHIALELETPADTVPEEGMAYIDPTIHCPGLVQKTTLALHELAARKGFHGVYINATTTHVMSQKIASELLGTSPCSMLVAIARNDFLPVDMPVSVQNRVSGIVHYWVMDRTPSTVYVPLPHREMVAEIYRWLGLPRTFGDTTEVPLPEQSVLESFVNKEINNCIINVRTLGSDCVEQIRQRLNAVRKDRVEAIFLRLPIDEPAACTVVEECGTMGFSFAGVIPRFLNGRDALILEWVGVPLDMDAVKIHGDNARRLFAYVRKCLGY